MALYRADPKDGTAWVTGASAGIGRELALGLAGAGFAVAATARREGELAELASEAHGLPGRIVPFPCDVTDAGAMEATVAAIESELGPVVLAVFNAGDFMPTRGDRLEVANFVATYRVNVFGVVHGLAPLSRRMAEHGRGHVAMVGSVSGYGGLPLAAAYGASKAALINMAAALKFDFDRMNIRIQIVNPGFVDTPLARKNKFPMPALVSVEDATRRILDGLARGGFEIAFPRRLSWALKLANLLPYGIYFPVMKRAMGWNRRPAKG